MRRNCRLPAESLVRAPRTRTRKYGVNKDMKTDERKRLYRSREKRRVAGICAGLADYLGVDATLVRIAWVLFALAGGPGVLVYIIMAAIVPEEPAFIQAATEKSKRGDFD